jgi:hypothetical protein
LMVFALERRSPLGQFDPLTAPSRRDHDARPPPHFSPLPSPPPPVIPVPLFSVPHWIIVPFLVWPPACLPPLLSPVLLPPQRHPHAATPRGRPVPPRAARAGGLRGGDGADHAAIAVGGRRAPAGGSAAFNRVTPLALAPKTPWVGCGPVARRVGALGATVPLCLGIDVRHGRWGRVPSRAGARG